MNRQGYNCDEFDFEGHPAVVIIPEKKIENPILALKTEYFEAFPNTENMLAERGHYIGFIKNDNRWGTDDDIDRKARFAKYVIEKYNLNQKCTLIGMSCGGIFAVKIAARYPEIISSIYVDAPVVNYMSCPCGFYKSQRFQEDHSEIINALSLSGISELLAYRDMPLDNLDRLVSNNIPAILVAGDSDVIVPYDENGIFIKRAYDKAGVECEVHIKPGCDHHPHGLEDPTPVVDFIEKHI